MRIMFTWGAGVVICPKISASSCSAAVFVFPRGARGDAAEGCRRAVIRSLAAALAASVEEMVGIVTCVGNQTKVSAIRSAEVSFTQTR